MKTKLVIFDFDGTLSKPNALPNSWARIWAKINRQEDDDRLYGMYKRGEIDYNQWAVEVLKVYRDAKVDKNLLSDIARETILLDESEYVLNYLHSKDIKVIVLSDGIKNIIEYVLGQCEKYIFRIEAQEILYDEDGIVNGITSLNHFIEDKSQYVNMILKELSLKPSEVIFFGNGKNDEEVYKSGVKTVCLNPDDADFENKTIWHNVIMHTNSLKPIFPFIEES